MEDATLTSNTTVESTTDYDKFQFLSNNREANRGHIEALKKAFDEYGNLTKTQPVLVNERFQIIDGQHRFVACMEREEPVFYNVVPGLGIKEARRMNILHRGWTTDDYAKSYADGGNRHYIEYMKLKEDYGFTHSVMMAYVYGLRDKRGMFADFREGQMEINDIEPIRERLDMLKAVEAIVGPRLAGEKVFASAFLRVIGADGFSLERMLKKLAERRDSIRRYSNIEDSLRQLEEIYNFGYSEANRRRLY